MRKTLLALALACHGAAAWTVRRLRQVVGGCAPTASRRRYLSDCDALGGADAGTDRRPLVGDKPARSFRRRIAAMAEPGGSAPPASDNTDAAPARPGLAGRRRRVGLRTSPNGHQIPKKPW